jgi:uroporphyrinogen decarboxylase
MTQKCSKKESILDMIGVHLVNSTERVRSVILGKKTDRTPIYGWVSANLTNELTEKFGSVSAFEDKYEFDVAHLFGGPKTYENNMLLEIRKSGTELTPDMVLDVPLRDPDCMEDYKDIISALKHHKDRERFCYVQTPGFFEP